MSDDADRYMAAAHAMQSGVAHQMSTDPDASGVSPKHLRVGVNTAHSDISALATLLIAKGVFTEAEYLTALADAMEKEAARYERALGVKLA